MGLDGEPVRGEFSHEPVWPRGEELLTEGVAQPDELCPQRRGAVVLLVEQDRQLVPGQPLRGRCQQQQDLAVAGTQTDRLTFAVAVVHGQQRVRPPQRLEHHEHPAAMALLPRAARSQLPRELCLGHPRRSANHGHRLGHHDTIITGDVQDTQQ